MKYWWSSVCEVSTYQDIYIYIIHLTNIISLHLIAAQYVKDYFNSEKESLLTLQILISKLSLLEELHSKTIVIMVDYICQQIQEFEKTMAGIILAYIKHNLWLSVLLFFHFTLPIDIILLDINMINNFGAVLRCMEIVLTEQNHPIPITGSFMFC